MFESYHCISCSYRELKAATPSNLAQVVSCVSKELAFLQLESDTSRIESWQYAPPLSDMVHWRFREHGFIVPVDQSKLPAYRGKYEFRFSLEHYRSCF